MHLNTSQFSKKTFTLEVEKVMDRLFGKCPRAGNSNHYISWIPYIRLSWSFIQKNKCSNPQSSEASTNLNIKSAPLGHFSKASSQDQLWLTILWSIPIMISSDFALPRGCLYASLFQSSGNVWTSLLITLFRKWNRTFRHNIKMHVRLFIYW